ncbi:SRPBCC domain-containing protein [Georgenia yuyongxinii]|uniref:ATPase n=1 Tax=Georgenia yuyongxinii TaxID=2589797 RepID=A0A552WT75_9MICO|nr:SRPBCC domain-containing protein [Georgenia yuyongxinii]TRW46051.1 ATPase [Georgenia yuyongxinii]
MIDIATQIGAIDRTVLRRRRDDGAEEVAVVATRTYDADAADVWDALTDPERLVRWFLPVRGDLHEGGTFQLEGNAGGQILRCRQASLLRVTFGTETSVVELRLTPTDGRTVHELEHTVPIEMAQSGAGAMWVGPGWDGALMGLGLYLDGDVVEDPVAAASSPEVVAFNEVSVRSWAATVEASGTATAEQLAEAVQVSLAQFAPGAADEASPAG